VQKIRKTSISGFHAQQSSVHASPQWRCSRRSATHHPLCSVCIASSFEILLFWGLTSARPLLLSPCQNSLSLRSNPVPCHRWHYHVMAPMKGSSVINRDEIFVFYDFSWKSKICCSNFCSWSRKIVKGPDFSFSCSTACKTSSCQQLNLEERSKQRHSNKTTLDHGHIVSFWHCPSFPPLINQKSHVQEHPFRWPLYPDLNSLILRTRPQTSRPESNRRTTKANRSKYKSYYLATYPQSAYLR